MFRDRRVIGRIAGHCLVWAVLASGLGGCAAVAIPLTAAEVGIGGFQAYKLVETSTGGSVGVAFPKKDGKEVAPRPLPVVQRVAVWPDDETEVFLAEKLMAAKHFDVVTPNRVRAILTEAKITTNINGLTTREQISAFRLVCRHSGADLVLASRDAGSVTRHNGLSFARPQKISKSALLAYSCARRRLIWHDEMTLVVEIGDKMPLSGDIEKVAGDAWAGRILAAEARGDTEIGQLEK